MLFNCDESKLIHSVPVIRFLTALDIYKNFRHTLTLLLEYSVYLKILNVQCKKQANNSFVIHFPSVGNNLVSN